METGRKRVLIVGGASGIGKATAEILIIRNYFPLIVDRDKVKLEQIRRKWGSKVCTLSLDIAQEQELKRLSAFLKDNGKALDAVVISAGVHSCYPIEYVLDKIIEHVIDVNLTSHIKVVRDVLPYVKDGGRIIGVSSVSARIGIPVQALYSASKAGLEMFYEALNSELRHRNIKCIIVQPGNVNTGFNETGNDYEPCGKESINIIYEKVVDRIRSIYGMPPEKVASVIVKAVCGDNPGLFYIVGLNALKAYWARKLLGRGLSIKLMKISFGLRR